MNKEDLLAIERRRQIAQALMEQGQEPIDANQVAGGYVVPVSPLQGLAKVAQSLAGAYIGKKADEKYVELRQKQIDDLSNVDYTNQGDAAKALMGSGYVDEAIKMLAARAEHGNRYQPTNQVVMGADGKLHVARYGSDPNSKPIIDENVLPNNVQYLDTGGGFTPVETKGYATSPMPSQAMPSSPVPVKEGTPEFEAVIRQLQSQGKDPGQPFDGLHLDQSMPPIAPIKKSLTPAQEMQYSPEKQAELSGAVESAKLPYKMAEQQGNAAIENDKKAYQEQQKNIVENYAKFGDIKTNLASFDRALAQVDKAEPYLGTMSGTRKDLGRLLQTVKGGDDEALKAASGLETDIFQPIMTLLKQVDASPSQEQQRQMREAFGNTNFTAPELKQKINEMKQMFLDKVKTHNSQAQEAINSGMKFPINPVVNFDEVGNSKPVKVIRYDSQGNRVE